MTEETKAKTVEKTEYDNVPVPVSARRKTFSLLLISFGYVFVATTMQIGGNIFGSMPFGTAMGVTFVGCGILAVLAIIMGIISQQTGLNTVLLSRYTFGGISSYVMVFIVAFTSMGWFAVDAGLVGQSIHALFPAIPEKVGALVTVVVCTLIALKGIKALEWLANVAVPVVIVFGVISIVKSLQTTGGLAGMAAKVTNDGSFTFNSAVVACVGIYAQAAVMFTPDIMRFAKSKKAAFIIMLLSLMIANPFVLLIGGFGASATGEYDIAYILAAQGLLVGSFLALVLNMWSTMNGCIYTGTLAVTSTVNVDRWKLVLGFGVIAFVLTWIDLFQHFVGFISLLSGFVPPLAGIYLYDYLITYKKKYPEFTTTKFKKINVASFIAWACAVAASYLIPWGLSIVNAVIVGFLVKLICDKVFHINSAVETA